jgi:hypothetical protein
MNSSENFIETDFSIEERFGLIQRKPDKYGFPNNVVIGYESPKTGVSGIKAIVTHHPVIIHFKGVLGGRLTID